jgi:hypothetical protein
LKLQAILLENLSTTDAVTISDGSSNAYSINGTNDKVVPIGGTYGEYFADALDDVATGAKAVDITPGTSEEFYLVLLFG